MVLTKKEAAELAARGHTTAQIAQIYGLTQNWVARMLHVYKVELSAPVKVAAPPKQIDDVALTKMFRSGSSDLKISKALGVPANQIAKRRAYLGLKRETPPAPRHSSAQSRRELQEDLAALKQIRAQERRRETWTPACTSMCGNFYW